MPPGERKPQTSGRKVDRAGSAFYAGGVRALPDPADLQALISEAQALPKLRARRGTLERLVTDYRRGFESEERALVVAFVGATGAGKSTLINALAGADVAEEGVDRPTSRHPVIYAPQDALLDVLAGVPAKVVRYEVRPGAPWSGQVFVDTPDLNSVVTEHRELARAIADRADVIVVVMHRGSVAEASQAEFLDEFARRRGVVFVLNFADQLGPEARTQLKQQIRGLAASRHGLGEHEVRVFAVSATLAKQQGDPTGELPELLSTLKELGSRSAIERVRRSNAVAVLRQLEGEVGGAQRELEEILAEIDQALGKGLAEVRPALEEAFSRRLDTAQGHLANEVRRQASGRWWGPAAWWMRLSMLGAGGLGAAAVVARRNLPLGLAVGAASAVLDRVRDEAHARSAERALSGPGSEEASDTVIAARTATAHARAVAHARGVEPGAVGLLEPATVAEALAQARTRAWRYTEADAVGDAVAGWWRWSRFLLLPLINLPLLALFGHVAWRVVNGYLAERYLDAGYFLNAAAMSAVLTVAGGVLASWSLWGATGRVKASARTRFRQELDALEAQLHQAAGEALLPARTAAKQLADAANWER